MGEWLEHIEFPVRVDVVHRVEISGDVVAVLIIFAFAIVLATLIRRK